MTYFIGVDIAKHTHYASVIDSYGQVHQAPFAFNNSKSGFDLFISTIKQFNISNCIVGFESTAHYHENFYKFMTDYGYTCVLINPLLTKRFRGLNIRDCKNDKVDSLSIASFLSFNHNSDKLHTSSKFIINELKTLCMQHKTLKEECTSNKIKLTSYLDRVFPELKPYIGSTLYSKTFLNFLKKFQTASQIKETRIDLLDNSINRLRHIFDRDDVEAIKELAKNSVGFHSDAIALQIQICVNQIELYNMQIREVEALISTSMQQLDNPLKVLPGMKDIHAAYIISAIVDITRFEDPSKVVAYAGLDPRVRQSGMFTASKTRMSKRGNKLLRYALIWSANNVRKNTKTLGDYYLEKRNAGKSHYNTLGHCARKLVNYIFYILTNPDKAFVLE